MHYCKRIDKKGVLLYEYSQSAILHAPHFRQVVNVVNYQVLRKSIGKDIFRALTPSPPVL